MAIIQKEHFSGVDINSTRIDSLIRAVDVKGICEAQAQVYETITGTSVSSSAALAAAHVHDGVIGSIIPIPLGSYHLDATMTRPHADFAEVAGGYAPLLYTPILCAPGVERVMVIGLGESITDLQGIRVRAYSYDADGFEEDIFTEAVDPTFAPGLAPSLSAGVPTIPWQIVVGVGGDPATSRWRGIEVAAWDGYFWPGQQQSPGGSGPPPTRRLTAVFVLPVDTLPREVLAAPAYEHPGAINPGLAAHPSLPTAFVGLESTLVDEDRALSSFVVRNMSWNDRIALDRLLNHRHSGAVRQGTVFPQCVLSHSVGVMRRPALGASSYQLVSDEVVGPPSRTWSGRIFAACVSTTPSDDPHTLAQHRFQLPRGQGSDLGFGGPTTSRLKLAFLINHVTSVNIFGRIRDDNNANSGSQRSALVTTAAGTGRRLIVLDDMMASTNAGGGGDDQVLEVQFFRNGSAVDGLSGGVYGYALGLV